MLKASVTAVSIWVLSIEPVCAQSMQHSEWQEEDQPAVRASGAAPQMVWNDRSLEQNALLLSLNEKISLLELDVIGKTSPHSTPASRILALENSVFGKPDTSGANAIERVSHLISALQPSNELVSMVVVKATSSPGWSFKATSAPWVNSTSQVVSAIEIQLGGKSKPDEPLIERVTNLEKSILPQDAVVDSTEMKKRIDNLLAAVAPTEKAIDKAKQIADSHAGWFWNPPQIHWLGSLGREAKSLGRSAENSTKAMVSSPTFWTLLIGAGALTALYFMGRGNNGQASLPVYIANERACVGLSNCNRCSNCRYCQYCNDGMPHSPCGVLLRLVQYGR